MTHRLRSRFPHLQHEVGRLARFGAQITTQQWTLRPNTVPREPNNRNLDPPQNLRKHYQTDDLESENRPTTLTFCCMLGRHQEERQIPDQEDQLRSAGAPPSVIPASVIPGQGVSLLQLERARVAQNRLSLGCVFGRHVDSLAFFGNVGLFHDDYDKIRPACHVPYVISLTCQTRSARHRG